MKKYLDELNNFINYLKVNGYKTSTVDSYFCNLKDFFKFLKNQKIEFNNFNHNAVEKYLESIKLKNSVQTINSKIYAITKYVNYVKKHQNINIILDIRPVKIKNKKEVNLIENISLIINHIEKTAKNSFVKNRDKLLINLIYYTGLRTKDILNIKIKDIGDNFLNFQDNKILLNNKLANQIKNYAKLMKLNNDNFLFINLTRAQKYNDEKKCLTEKSVEDIFNKYKEILGDNLSLRDLRISFVVNLDNYFSRIEIKKIYRYYEAETDLDYLNYIKTK